jgi:hypothetical protein
MSRTPVVHTNQHNVYVKTGLATRQQLTSAVAGFKTALAITFPGKGYEKGDIDVNFVETATKNFAYLWVEKPEVYFILCGRNPDGTERTEVVKEEVTSATAPYIDLNLEMMNMDFDTIFESMNVQVIRSIRTLAPLLTLPGYMYNEEQRKSARSALLEEVKELEETERKRIEKLSDSERKKAEEVAGEIIRQKQVEADSVSTGFFYTYPATTYALKPQQCMFKIRGEVPLWVTEDMLKNHFLKYASNGTTKKEGYPRIHLRPMQKKEDHNSATIEFSKSFPADATFALQMTRKTTFVAPPGCRMVPPGTSVQKIFDFFRNFDQDENKVIESPESPSSGSHFKGPHTSSKGANAFLNRSKDTGFATRNEPMGGAGGSDGFTHVKRRK